MAMGVRFGEKAWKEQIESLIDRNRDEIAAILGEYGVPCCRCPPRARRTTTDANALRPLVPFFAALLLAGPAGAIAAADDISPASGRCSWTPTWTTCPPAPS